MASDEVAAAPERAFRLLSDELRVEVLRALWAAEQPLAFSELRERVGSPDSGQFNYHLGELRDHFVVKRDGAYELSQAGREVVRAVLAGTMTDQPRVEPAPIDGECAACGASLVVRYDGHAAIECAGCGETVMWNEFPPAGLAGRTPAALAAAFDSWTRNRFHLAMDGICPNCAAGMSTEVAEGPDGRVRSRHQCGNCRYEARAPLFGHVLRHPAVVAFYHERGVDVTDVPFWELQALAREFDEVLVDGDPGTARVTIESDGERLELTLDERLDVTGVDRSPR